MRRDGKVACPECFGEECRVGFGERDEVRGLGCIDRD